jgi:alpha-galactosidase
MQRHPNLLIEQCSSGGLRIDLETIRHGHTYWKSDDTYDQALMRFHQTGGNQFLLAGHLNTNYCRYVSQGEILGLFAGPLGFGADFRELNAEQKEVIRRSITAYKQVRQYLNHDYYPLFAQELTTQTWDGWQFLDTEKQQGCVTIYRPADSPYPTATIRLRGLDPKRTYRFKEMITGGQWSETGADLKTGIRRELQPDTGNVWRYVAQ